MPSSLLTTDLPQNKLRVDGVSVSKDKIFDAILEELAKNPRTPSQLGAKLGLKGNTISKTYIPPLVTDNKIKKVEGTQMYQLAKSNATPQEIKLDALSNSQILQTELFKNWIAKKSKTKRITEESSRFARICLGLVNPNFKIHPDSITKDNWHEIVTNIRDAILEVSKRAELTHDDKQVIRHAIMYGLDKKVVINISKEDGINLGIDGKTDKAQVSDLHIEKEQTKQAKIILKADPDSIWFLKFGVKGWSGVRPSTLYIIETKSLKFYDRTVEYSEISGERFYKEEIVEHDKKLLLLFPQLEKILKIGKFTHRACTFEVFENKNQHDYQKFIFDEEYVIPLEKYIQQRTFQKKKYLFWQDNNTEFTFATYDTTVRTQVNKDNKYFKQLFLQLGFTKEDFGKRFRANYGFRHFSIQMWLEYTDYDFNFVASMFHEDVNTLKKWYGKMRAEHLAKIAKQVVVA